MIIFSNDLQNNDALNFIEKRLDDDCYRGGESSQHNRYEKEEIFKTLTILNKFAPNKTLLQIRDTDLSKRPTNEVGEQNYADFCNEVCAEVGKGTQDSIRKNIFVDVHRMGFIQRYNPQKQPIEPYKQSHIKYVSLTDEGLKFINSNLIDRPFIFTKGLYNLLGSYIDITLEIMTDNDNEIDDISCYEFMFFVSVININTSFSITKQRSIELLNSYRSLTIQQQNKAIEQLKERLKPESYSGDKTVKRDWHNWKNKVDQIYYLFNQTAYFDIVNDNLVLANYKKIRNNKTVEVEIKKRSNSEKIAYFDHHSVAKQSGFELHHVVALAFSNSPEQYEQLDNWQNMVYIDAGKHAKITQNNNRNIKMLVGNNNSDIELEDYVSKDKMYLEYNTNIVYNPDNKTVMLKYNEKMLEQLF